MVFEGKELNDITIKDIQFLIDNQIAEDTSIEYKSQMWERNDEGTREMLRDISSMANAIGGHLILGIEEDEKNDGLPRKIVGISEADKAIERIMNVCLSCINEKIIGLNTKSIFFERGNHVVIIRIPRSTRIPHMITFRNLYQCWRRHGKQKNVMSVDEIREACLKVESVRENLEAFVAKRIDNVIKAASDKPLHMISATPMIVKDDIIDIFDQELMRAIENPPSTRGEKGVNVKCRYREGSDWRPTLYGIKAEMPNWKSMEILRNGHIEFIAFLDINDNIFQSFEVVEYLVNFMMFFKKFLSYTQIAGPIIISVGLINAENIGLYETGTSGLLEQRGIIKPGLWTGKRHLFIPSMQVKSFDNPHRVAKIFADRIWNAFGFKSAPFFDGEENFIIPKN